MKLVVSHRIESVNVRLLVEHSTGIYSGSMETNSTLSDLLHSEGFCGQRLSIIQVSLLPFTRQPLEFAHNRNGRPIRMM